ncbi:unnamed protein product [Hydatigera taeniaeformis]|uniref:Secreted protein n=1 Tax=Hydatigena taeniaeformis TaxID=6205 RepID=A0A0R3WMV1_HYDTA|nr:unnamed protein product [Hydatigera taeniaeformis]
MSFLHMCCKLIILALLFVSVAIACVSREEDVGIELSPDSGLIDNCPEVVDVDKEMPRIVSHLVRKALTSVVFTLNRMGRKARGDCSKASFQSLCRASKTFPNKYECTVVVRHLKFDCASHTGPLSAVEAKLVNDHFINQVVMNIVVAEEEEIIRVTDVMSFEADVSGMRGIPGLRESALQRAMLAGLKVATGSVSCRLS